MLLVVFLMRWRLSGHVLCESCIRGYVGRDGGYSAPAGHANIMMYIGIDNMISGARSPAPLARASLLLHSAVLGHEIIVWLLRCQPCAVDSTHN